MFTLIRKQQESLSSIILSLFIGSWLLLFCQSCLAVVNDDHDTSAQAGTETMEQCHEESQQAVPALDSPDTEHCVGVCDCDESVAVAQPTQQQVEKISCTYALDDLHVADVGFRLLHNKSPPLLSTTHLIPRPSTTPVSLFNTLLI